jgi:hypothetical protein
MNDLDLEVAPKEQKYFIATGYSPLKEYGLFCEPRGGSIQLNRITEAQECDATEVE